LDQESKINDLAPDTPQAALQYLEFENNELYFIIDEKGYIDSAYYNLWYNGWYHDFNYMSYLSINDGTVTPLSSDEFVVVKSLTNLTEFVYGDYTRQLVAESIIRHTTEEVYVKIQVKLYPDEEFFVTTYHIWSDTVEITKAELFFYNDLDLDETFNNDNADYDSSTGLIYGTDRSSDNTLGWISTIPIDSWDVGEPNFEVEPNVLADDLGQEESVSNQDISIATKYSEENLNVNETWVVPLIYGFSRSEAGIYGSTVAVKDQFINDFSVLDFTTNITETASVQATILNGGQNTLNRTVSVFRNGTSLASKDITLSPGETGVLNFDDLVLFAGEYNELTVSVNDMSNDYIPNNNLSHIYLTFEDFRINFKDFDGFDEQGLQVSLFDQSTQILEKSTFTNAFGNATYSNLPENDYTLRAYAPWIDNQLIYEENFTFSLHDKYYQVHTDMTTLNLHIQDVVGFPVENAFINITQLGITDLWTGHTDQYGNITFKNLIGSYNISVSYNDYDAPDLIFDPLQNYALLGQSFISRQVNLTSLIMHFETSGSQENLTGAKVEFYDRINSSSFGNLIGYEIADILGNVSIRWSSLLNYSIRVSIFSEYKLLGVSEDYALNYTNSPFTVYIFDDIDVSLEGSTLDQYTTDIIQLSSPTSCTWGEDIDFQFMFNVSGPAFEGPLWANETLITIRNQESEIVYEGNATIIADQIGNHSFVLNSSSGFFSAGATYTIYIFAQIYGYLDPTSEFFSFYIRNITTDLVLHSSSETIYWNENFTISANYVDTAHGGILIKDGVLTVTWSNYIIDASMENLGNGTYTIDINSSLGVPGSRLVTIKAVRENYDEDDGKFSLTVREVPTTVNNSIIFDSRHSQYVTTQNLTLDYDFIDAYRNISIPGLSPTYTLINSETKESYTGSLTYITESSVYSFDPKSALLPVGSYFGSIRFSLENYEISDAFVQIEILPIPTSLNDTSLPEIPYELLCYSTFTLDLQYFNDFSGGTVGQANTSYNVRDLSSDEVFSKPLEELGDGLYRFDPNTKDLPIGTYSVNIIMDKTNYTGVQTEFTFKINEIPLTFTFEGGSVDNEHNLTTITEYNIVRDNYFYFNIEILDIFNDPVQECNISYMLTKDGEVSRGYLFTDNMGNYFGNFSEFAEVGLYSLSLTVHKANYTIETHQVYINVEYPSYFGISLPYLIIGVTISLIAISMALGYAGIRQARIPRYIKDLTKLEKILKNPKNILPDRYLSRIEQLKEKYGNRWEQVDVVFPLKQQDDEIVPFIKAYQNATGRMLLTGEAKRYLDDLAIYSEDEIRVRLQREHISGEYLSMLMEIILNYGRTVNSQDIIITEDSNDDFDLDELTSANGDES
jgi:hypothetical protein